MINDSLYLIKKIEKRISNWAYRFLSIGGRITLIWFVLQGILVYWFSLIMLLSSILNILRSKLFNFLWEGSGNEKKISLSGLGETCFTQVSRWMGCQAYALV